MVWTFDIFDELSIEFFKSTVSSERRWRTLPSKLIRTVLGIVLIKSLEWILVHFKS